MNIEILKQKLLDEKNILEQELSGIATKNSEEGDWTITLARENDADLADPNDRGDRFEEFAERSNTFSELEKQYNEVKNALNKIEKDDGSFGMCEISGKEIEEDRLMANPSARTCKEHMNE